MKFPSSVPLLSVLILAGHVHGSISVPFQWNFSESPRPFVVNVEKEFIDNTRLKASLTRFVTPIQEPDPLEGPSVYNATIIRDYWVNEYDWDKVEKHLNQK
jgi:hypothetical protein